MTGLLGCGLLKNVVFTLQLHSYILDICSGYFTVEIETFNYVCSRDGRDVDVPARGSFESATTLVLY